MQERDRAAGREPCSDAREVLAALCLFLAAVEYAIPKPLPFLRLGLANMPVLIAVQKFSARDVAAVTACKVIGQALMTGTLLSYVFLFSAAGSFAAALSMLLCHRVLWRRGWVSCLGISVLGALSNGGAQLACARFLLFGEGARYVAPLLLASSLITGGVLGLFVLRFEEESLWYKTLCGTPVENPPDTALSGSFPHHLSTTATDDGKTVDKFGSVRMLAVLLALAVFLTVRNVPVRWGFVLAFFSAACVSRRGKVRVLPSVLVTASVTVLCLLRPSGQVIFRLGSFPVTRDPLLEGLGRSAVLVGMVFASQCAVSRGVRLPGKAGRMVSGILFYFDGLTSRRIAFRRGNVIRAIDERLLELSA